MTEVRLAGPQDEKEILRLMLMHHSENAIFPFSVRKVKFHMDCILRQMPGGFQGVIGVIGPIGALEAMAFLIIGSEWYTEVNEIIELMVFVDPQHRKSDHLKTLVTWMKQQSDEANATPLFSSIVATDRTAAKCKLYGRMLPKLGEFFMYNRPSIEAANGIE